MADNFKCSVYVSSTNISKHTNCFCVTQVQVQVFYFTGKKEMRAVHSEMGKHEKGRTEEEERLFLKVRTTRGHLINRKFEAYM